MFNIGAGEILVVLVVAFVIVGPDDLPKVARWLGRMLRNLRRLIHDFKTETGWGDVEKEIKGLQRDVKDTVREMDVTADLKGAVKEVKSEIENVTKDVQKDFKEIDKDMKRDLKAVDNEVRAAVNEAGKAAREAELSNKTAFSKEGETS